MEPFIYMTVILSLILLGVIHEIRETKKYYKELSLVVAGNRRELERAKSQLQGCITKLTIENKVARETAARAFNMASSSQVCIASLQTTLVKKPYKNYDTQVREALVAKEIDKQFGGDDVYDYLYAVLPDDERDVLDKAREHSRKFTMKKDA